MSPKTRASERDLPLVGDASWAAGMALEDRQKANEPVFWLFPRYASNKEIKATHASVTMNKWLRSLEGVNDQKTCHWARHAMRDRLRAAQVPFEIQDCLGGWGEPHHRSGIWEWTSATDPCRAPETSSDRRY